MLMNNASGVPISEEEEVTQSISEPPEQTELTELREAAKHDIQVRLLLLMLDEQTKTLKGYEDCTKELYEQQKQMIAGITAITEHSDTICRKNVEHSEAILKAISEKTAEMQTSNEMISERLTESKAEIAEYLRAENKNSAADTASRFDEYCKKIVDQHTGDAEKRAARTAARLELKNSSVGRTLKILRICAEAVRTLILLGLAALAVLQFFK